MNIVEVTRKFDSALRSRLIQGGVNVDRLHQHQIALGLLLLTCGVVFVERIALDGAKAERINEALPDIKSELLSLFIAVLLWIWTRRTRSRTLGLIAYALLWACGLSLFGGFCVSLLIGR